MEDNMKKLQEFNEIQNQYESEKKFIEADYKEKIFKKDKEIKHYKEKYEDKELTCK